MPRMPAVGVRESLSQEGKDAHDYLVKTRGALRGGQPIMLNNPDLTYRLFHLGSRILYESLLPKNVRGLVGLTACWEFGGEFEKRSNARAAREGGASEEAIQAIEQKKPLNGLSEEEELPIRCVRELVREHRISPATFDAAQQKYGNAALLDLIATATYYITLACFYNTLEVLPPADA